MNAPAVDTAASSRTLPGWRLHMLRAGYLLLVVGLGATIWPELLHHPQPWPHQRAIVVCMLAAMSALAVVGLRYPLQMLPLALFEITWKGIWLAAVAAPAWASHTMDAATAELAAECSLVVLFLIITPWDYVFDTFVRTFARPPVRRDRSPAAVCAGPGGGVRAG
jgi:hypothetical protein